MGNQVGFSTKLSTFCRGINSNQGKWCNLTPTTANGVDLCGSSRSSGRWTEAKRAEAVPKIGLKNAITVSLEEYSDVIVPRTEPPNSGVSFFFNHTKTISFYLFPGDCSSKSSPPCNAWWFPAIRFFRCLVLRGSFHLAPKVKSF